MTTLLPTSQPLLDEAFADYPDRSKQLLQQIGAQRHLSEFDRFNTRFKLNLSMEISYGNGLKKITREHTLRCYQLMLKLSDLWFCFEHLVKVMDSHEIYPSGAQKCRPYEEAFYHSCGVRHTTDAMSESLYATLFAQPRKRRELYLFVDYLAKLTKGGTRTCIQGVAEQVRVGAP